MILRPSYLHNGISYTGRMSSLYLIRAHDVVTPLCMAIHGEWWHMISTSTPHYMAIPVFHLWLFVISHGNLLLPGGVLCITMPPGCSRAVFPVSSYLLTASFWMSDNPITRCELQPTDGASLVLVDCTGMGFWFVGDEIQDWLHRSCLLRSQGGVGVRGPLITRLLNQDGVGATSLSSGGSGSRWSWETNAFRSHEVLSFQLRF